MKIYNEIVIDMNPESSSYKETLYEDSYEYKGDVHLAQGGTPLLGGEYRSEDHGTTDYTSEFIYVDGKYYRLHSSGDHYYELPESQRNIIIESGQVEIEGWSREEYEKLSAETESILQQADIGEYDFNDDGQLDTLDILIAKNAGISGDDLANIYKAVTTAQEFSETAITKTLEDEGLTYTKLPEFADTVEGRAEQQIFETAKSSIESYLKEWRAIVTEGEWDEFEGAINQASVELGFAADDVKAAFEEIPGAGEIIQEDYTTGLEAAETTRTEGLEETITSREEQLEAVREGAGGDIRAAEAKIGAAGFASTGVGRTARETLAGEIGEEARDIDVGFTEERTDIKSGFKTEEEGLGTTRERALEKTTDPWEDATTEYQRLSELYFDPKTGVVAEQGRRAESRLIDIQQDIQSRLFDIQELTGFEEWDPFKAGGGIPGLEGMAGEYGWTAEGFDPEATKGLFFDPETMMGQFKAYQPTGVEFYDPEYVLPWEEEDDGSGGGGGGRNQYQQIPGMK